MELAFYLLQDLIDFGVGQLQIAHFHFAQIAIKGKIELSGPPDDEIDQSPDVPVFIVQSQLLQGVALGFLEDYFVTYLAVAFGQNLQFLYKYSGVFSNDVLDVSTHHSLADKIVQRFWVCH